MAGAAPLKLKTKIKLRHEARRSRETSERRGLLTRLYRKLCGYLALGSKKP